MSNVRIVIVLLLLLSGNHVKAQFNTVSCPGNRYKATVENPTRTTNETEATPESITSENEKSVPDKVSLSSADTKKEEQVARYLSVCYPLSHIKIRLTVIGKTHSLGRGSFTTAYTSLPGVPRYLP